MRIAIFISGSMTQGLNSPTPGEGRWGQSLARILAENGHQVDCISGRKDFPPSWGNSEPVHNVTIGYEVSRHVVYDLVIYTPWDHQFNGSDWESCLTIPMKARYWVHCQFSWGKSVKDNHTCYNNRHILAYPYIQEGGQFPTDRDENPYPTFPLPMPLYRELAPLNVEKRKHLMWSTKDVFHPEWPEGHHVPRIGHATMKAIKRLREKHEFDTHFLSTKYFDPSVSRHAQQYEINHLVASIPGATSHDLVPRDTLLDWFSTSRITTIVSGLLGSFGESIVSGSVPLCYLGHIYRDPAKKHGILLDTFNATEDEIYDCMERLYEDDDLYMNVIQDYRHEMRYYSYDTSYSYFKDMCQQLGLEI